MVDNPYVIPPLRNTQKSGKKRPLWQTDQVDRDGDQHAVGQIAGLSLKKVVQKHSKIFSQPLNFDQGELREMVRRNKERGLEQDFDGLSASEQVMIRKVLAVENSVEQDKSAEWTSIQITRGCKADIIVLQVFTEWRPKGPDTDANPVFGSCIVKGQGPVLAGG